ncbi:hypothetical protein SCP_0106800 [Sparassis crispa]|uniref:CN hydrolase domain-containing protein n=1 Tax=Sparassis crispa TaxID=139825 RepID=A0A401G6L1_9APHY|nr:hypothetical protein SCP_0106800 [Sparassis crispa]GBE77798.1 hypothetical protein SCP_0106800 [Sparassis crispa]
MTSLPGYVIQHPSRVFLSTTTALGALALSPSPPLIPLILLLATLHLHLYMLIPRHKVLSHGSVQVLFLSGAAGLAHVGPSFQALSTPAISFVSLGVISFISSSFALLSIVLSYYGGRLTHSHWTQALLFPSIWASTWGIVAYSSPVGRLVTWSPVVGLGYYNWMREIFGQYGIDWVVAGWAVVIAAAVGQWLVGPAGDADVASSEPEHLISLPLEGLPGGRISKDSKSKLRHMLVLAGFLVILTLPSFFMSSLPLPVNSPGITPLGVACALPYPHRSGRRRDPLTLLDFIMESQRLQSQSNIVLWPEGAVRFDTLEQKQRAFLMAQRSMNAGRYYAISFEEYVPPQPSDDQGVAGIRRNGLVLLGSTGPPVFEYYKRKLVPIAESFSLTSSSDPPTIFNLELGPPKSWNKTTWAPGNHTRPIPLTASICLDFSSSSAFDGLPSRPALILAPARTWHIDVGYAMWQQARARAEEIGSTVLWCDGGEGGVSGIAGGGMHEIVQVGQGSWTRTIGVHWPFDQRLTFFARGGDYAALAAIWAILGAGWGIEFLKITGCHNGHRFGTWIMGQLRKLRALRSPHERDQEILIDDS